MELREAQPTFLLTHLHQSRLSDLQEEVLVLFVLFVIDNIDLNRLTEEEKKRQIQREKKRERK